MKFADCKDCGYPTGLRARICPRCGVRRTGLRSPIVLVVFPAVAIVAIVMLLSGLPRPRIFEEKLSGDEALVMEALRAIRDAEVAYRAARINVVDGISQYAELEDLGAGPNPYIDAELASGRKYGYEFSLYADVDSEGNPAYQAYVHPENLDLPGKRYFVLYASGEIDSDEIPASLRQVMKQDYMAIREFRAATNLEMIHSAQEQYSIDIIIDKNEKGLSDITGEYASLSTLLKDDPDLANRVSFPSSGGESDYTFFVIPSTDGNEPRYTAMGIPTVFGKTGVKTFFIDETGVVRFTEDGSEPGPHSPIFDSWEYVNSLTDRLRKLSGQPLQAAELSRRRARR